MKRPALTEHNKLFIKQFVVEYPQYVDVMVLQQRLEDIADAFYEHAAKDTERADLAQILNMAETLKLDKTRLELKQMVTNADDDGSGTLTYREFVNMILADEGLLQRPLPARSPTKPRRQSEASTHRRMRKPRRGHLNLSCSLEMASEGYELVVDVFKAKHLRTTHSSYVKLYIEPDPARQTKRKTGVRSGVDPEFHEHFTWELPDGFDMEAHRLFISVWEKRTFSNDCVGCMSFLLSDILDMEETASGWFILLDEKQGDRFNFPSPEGELKGRASRTMSRVGLKSPQALETLKVFQSSDFKIVKVLGKGSFGKVYLAENFTTADDKLVAIKVLKKDALAAADDVEAAYTEKRVFMLVGNAPFTSHLLGVFETEGTLNFVMEPILGGSLLYHTEQAPDRRLPEATVAFYVAEIASALFFLHGFGIIYRDVKPENILIDSTGHGRLIDFGLAKDGLEPGEMAHTFCGTPRYLAPEVVQYKPYNFMVDFWSLGILAYESMVGHKLFDGDDEIAIFDSILQQEITFPSSLSKHARSFLQALIERDPASRLGARGEQPLRNHPFLKSIDWAKLEKKKSKAPIVPKLQTRDDVSNMDPTCILLPPSLTPIPDDVIASLDQDLFAGFASDNLRGDSVPEEDDY